MIVSFAYTSEPLLKGFKTVTRRMWKESHAKWFLEGRTFDAWDHLPFAGGKKIAELVVETPPYREPVEYMTPLDVAREGYPGMTVDQFLQEIWQERAGGSLTDEPYVLSFRVTAVLFDGMIKGRPEGGRRMKYKGPRLPVPSVEPITVHFGEDFNESARVKFGWVDNRGGNPFYVLVEGS